MKATISVLSAALCAAAFADTTVYRLELEDEVPYIVGQDGVRRPVAILDRDEYDAMKGDVAKMMSSMNSSPSGRVKLHGKIVHTFIDEENHQKGEVHEDGYQHVEKFAPVRPRVVSAARKKIEEKKPKSGYRGIYSKRYLEMLKKRQKAKEPKVVTIEHDANSGKDTVK